MEKTLYQQLKDAESRARELQDAISRCKHEFVSEVPKAQTITTPVYDPFSGTSTTFEKTYAMVGRRSCARCGLTQESISHEPGKWGPWKAV